MTKHYLTNQNQLTKCDQTRAITNLNPQMFIRGVEELKSRSEDRGWVKAYEVEVLESSLKTYLHVIQGIKAKAIEIEAYEQAIYLRNEEERATALELGEEET